MLQGYVSTFLDTIWKWYTASQMLRLKAIHFGYKSVTFNFTGDSQ